MAEVLHRYIGKDGKLPKVSPAEREEQARRSKLAAELNDERTRGARVKRLQGEMLLAKARGDRKELVEKQAAYLLVALRQRILSLPQTYSRRLLNISDSKEMAAWLKEISLAMLEELRNMPARVTDPNWLDRLEEDHAE
jgi:hypothetical protein